VARIGEMTGTYRVFVGKGKGKRPQPGCGLENNIRMDFKK
jgi:hypothetical protein